jgi:membrane-associated phospholipid phosphatase
MRRLSLAVLTLVAALGVVVFRFLGTRTTFGQRFDISAIVNGLTLGATAQNSSDAVLTAISVVSFALIGGLLVGCSLLERRLDLVAAVAITLGGSFATTEYLKPSLHARGEVPDYLARGFPSGHSTVALALGLSFVLVSPRRQRPVAAVAAALYAAGMGAALVFNAWHLPSDVGGGFCMATAWAAAAAQLVRRPLDRGVPGRLVGAAVVLVALAAVAALHLRPGLSFTVTSHGRLFEAALGIAITAAVCCAAFAYAIAERSASATRS